MRHPPRCYRFTLPALAVLLAAAAVALAAQDEAPAPAAGHVRYGKPRRIATLADGRINESSGLAAGRNRPGVFWTHNDSGDAARLYAFDRRGRRLATCTLAGVEADDWEDIASFRRGGRNFLLVADIGDNWWSRAECTLLLLEEPAVGTPEKPVTATVPVLQTIRFVYEGGPRDCEALGVDPDTGRCYFVTKEGIRCKVYRLSVPDEVPAPSKTADAPPAAPPGEDKPHTARQVGEIATSPVVAMDISPDGRRAIVLTYADALEFVRRGDESWPEAFARKPRTVVMPRRRQGESICYGPDGRTLYLTSEHTPTPLLEVPVAADDWHHPLYLSRGGYWHARVPVRIVNRTGAAAAGTPLAVRVGKGEGEADLAGARAESVRVVTADGTDLLYDLRDADGRPVRKGPIPAGATLVLPAEAPAGGAVTYYVYIENPSAWAVAEFLDASVGVRNGGVERGEDGAAVGWRHDRGDEKHRAEWVKENPHAGERCLKTVVAEGAEPSWISTRQRGIHVTGGVRYRLTGWVRAENVQGEAGWYVHLEPEKGSFLAAKHVGAGGGTYDWTKVTAEFTAPEEAVRASLGTVLRGTGTAWFDDVRLERLDPPRLSATPLPRETMDLRRVGGGQAWLDPAGDAPVPPHRMAYRAFNFAERDADGAGLVSADLAALAGRLRAPLKRDALVVTRGREVLEHVAVGDRLLFEAAVPARSVCDYHVYAATAPVATAAAGQGAGAAAEADRAAYARLLTSPRNRVRNPSFEAAGDLPDDWTGGTEKPRAGGTGATVAEGGLFGDRCACIHVPDGAKAGWIGWHQAHAVEAGRTYLYAAWVKCEGIVGTGVRLHAHCRTADGTLCDPGGYNSVGSPLEGTRGWTLLSGTLTMPPDGAKLELHLTMNARGTLWHDGVLLAAVQEAAPLGLQARRDRTRDGLAAWPVNPVAKVFRWDAPPQKPTPARLYAARNEAEPLQLAVRSPTAVRGVGVRVEVDPPKGPGGAVLEDIETAVVGYVPIDHPTSYYRSESPAWHRKYPRRPGRCDGWAGWWPDPLLPGKTFVLEPDRTQPVWVTVHVPKDAPAGDYRGTVRLVVGGGEAGRGGSRQLRGGSRQLRGGSPHPPRTSAGNEVSAAGTETRRARSAAHGRTRPAVARSRREQSAAGTETRRATPVSPVLAEIPFTVHVWDFALPEEEHVKAIYDVRLHGAWWRDDVAGDRQAYLERFWTFMAERRVSPDRIHPAPTIRYADGKVEADFAAYDEAAAYYFDRLGRPHTYTPRQFYCFGWGHPPRTMCGEAPYPGEYPYEGADRSQLRPEYKRAYQACLRAYWNHMKEKGWADRVVLYISDEPHDRRHDYVVRQMKALCAMIHEVDPAIPIYSSTWHHQPAWDGSLDVWGVGHQGRTPVDTMRAIRGRGDTLWFTTDGEMCTDTPYCAVERLLPHYCFHWGAEAYEFWGIDWLTYNPYDYGWHAYIHQSDRPGSSYYVRYPNGDGYLAYPGSPAGREGPVSSIRLEQAREGVEDYEYLYLLQKRIAAAKQAGRDAADAEAVLKEAADLVTIPNPGGRYATKILPDPDAVLRLKRRLGRAIEALSRKK